MVLPRYLIGALPLRVTGPRADCSTYPMPVEEHSCMHPHVGKQFVVVRSNEPLSVATVLRRE